MAVEGSGAVWAAALVLEVEWEWASGADSGAEDLLRVVHLVAQEADSDAVDSVEASEAITEVWEDLALLVAGTSPTIFTPTTMVLMEGLSTAVVLLAPWPSILVCDPSLQSPTNRSWSEM